MKNKRIWIQGVGTDGGNNNRLTLVSGMPSGLSYNTSCRGTILYSNGIAFADPYNGNSNNDSGWIRHLETSADSGTLEIAVGNNALNEQIHFRWYTNSSAETIVYDITVPRATGTLALTSQIPTTLPANGGNADTVDNEHASNFSYTHQSSFDFSKIKSGRIVTFDQRDTDYGWINGFASTYNNYLTSVIFNTHRTSNWYVGYIEGNSGTSTTNGLNAVRQLAFLDSKVADSDKLDGIHANGLLTALSNSNNGISITVGGTTKSVSNISVNHASNADTALKVYGQVSDTGSHELVRCSMSNDQFRIIAGSSGKDKGWAEIAIGNNANEPIYVRQYSGAFASVVRTLTLLDAKGYTHFPSYINIGGNENNNSSPDRVWGSNGSDSYLRSYRTSALNVNYAASAGNADTVDGYHATSGRTFNGDINWSSGWNDSWSDGTNKHPWYGFDHRYPNTGAYSTTITDFYGMTIKTHNTLRLDYGKLLLNGTSIYDINVASASKLATARSIWGQSFNGTNNIGGTILPSATHTYNLGSTTYMFEKTYTRYVDTDNTYDLCLSCTGIEVLRLAAADKSANINYNANISGNLSVNGLISNKGILPTNYEVNNKGTSCYVSADALCSGITAITDSIQVNQVTVQYSNNNGNSWTNYPISNDAKFNLYANNAGLYQVYLGYDVITGNNDTEKLAQIKKNELIVSFYISNNCYTQLYFASVDISNGINTICTVEILNNSGAVIETYTKRMNGWNQLNYINLSNDNTAQNVGNDSKRYIRFRFKHDQNTTALRNAVINKIRIFSFTKYSFPTDRFMGHTGHIYNFDYNMNTYFPNSILAKGGVTAYQSSDIRLKTNITKLNCLKVIKSIGGTYEFDYICDHKHSIGFIAQNVNNPLLKDIVAKDDNGYLKINYWNPKLISLAFGALTEIDDEVDKLKARVRELESEVEYLKNKDYALQ